MNERAEFIVTRPKSRALAVVKVLVSVTLIGGAVVYLLGGSLQDSLVYDRTVDEVVLSHGELEGHKVRVGGRLSAGSHRVISGTTDHEFALRGQETTVHVRYTGLWPDAATEERELMVEGSIGPDGVIDADRVLARCPSRYKKRVSGETPTE